MNTAAATQTAPRARCRNCSAPSANGLCARCKPLWADSDAAAHRTASMRLAHRAGCIASLARASGVAFDELEGFFARYPQVLSAAQQAYESEDGGAEVDRSVEALRRVSLSAVAS